MVAHRRVTHRDRCASALRRNGSGSFYAHEAIEHAKSVHPRQDRRSTSYIHRAYMSQYYEYVQKGLLIRTQKIPLKLRPTEKFKIILRRAPDVLGPNPSLVEFGNYLRAETGCLKEVPKVAIWEMYLAAHEKSDGLQVEYDELKVQYKQAREGVSQPRAGPSEIQEMAAVSRRSSVAHTDEGIDAQQFGAPVVSSRSLTKQLSARDSGSIQVDEPMEVETSGATRAAGLPCPVETPQRSQPNLKYPTPPSTASPVVRRHRGVVLSTLVEEPLRAMGATELSGSLDNDGAEGGLPEFDRIIHAVEAARAKYLKEKLELERQIQEARASTTPDQAMNVRRIAELEDRLRELQNEYAALERSLQEREAQLAAARAENDALADERDLYQRKHFVTAVALKGSQIQVEKRDEEGKSLLGTIANMIGLSRWRNP
ncbi:hypothetical protein PYCCODRAFT_1243229 [Trametes coccinea BRFM310]|uniref:Uncharacterized protein n=1 Tax=Trametes coccinea (strain BRFM310) TaxID=1353009 RepID=A0A1Y2IWK5_TRAC3|nr:hypothetical protein PYCCODRAFT_1243229 [Trametes coccinea BRFM310]